MSETELRDAVDEFIADTSRSQEEAIEILEDTIDHMRSAVEAMREDMRVSGAL